MSRPALRPTKPPIQWVPGAFSLGIKRTGREAGRSPPSSAEVKNAWSYTSTPQYAFMAWCSAKAQELLNRCFTNTCLCVVCLASPIEATYPWRGNLTELSTLSRIKYKVRHYGSSFITQLSYFIRLKPRRFAFQLRVLLIT
jgi:hypothetical protein